MLTSQIGRKPELDDWLLMYKIPCTEKYTLVKFLYMVNTVFPKVCNADISGLFVPYHK